MGRFVSFTAALLVAASLAGFGEAVAAAATQAVLVTGASTGIGRKVTEKLAADGYFVYAGARKEQDLAALNSIRNVQAIRLDVTKPEDLEVAVATISKAGRGLYGLVNNAGVGTIAEVVDTKPEEFDIVMAVNVYGPWRVTRAFAPLIIASKGRVITIGSINGIISGKYISAYAMSKHAMEAFTDALAEEMAPLGVQVSIVDPGAYRSEIFVNEVRRTGQALKDADRLQFKEPDEVAAAVEQALFEPHPKRRYMVVPNREQARATIDRQLDRLVELNERQPYSYDRQELVRLLEDALSRAAH